jgi:hypothetical protein
MLVVPQGIGSVVNPDCGLKLAAVEEAGADGAVADSCKGWHSTSLHFAR